MTRNQIIGGVVAVVVAASAYGYYENQRMADVVLDNVLDRMETEIDRGPDDPESSEPIGPGSGDELAPGETNEPTGPGSGDELGPGETNEPEGPGSGDELPPEDEPTGPGSGDELKPGEEPEPEGPGSGDELPPLPEEEPKGPGSGEEVEPDQFEKKASGSCNIIASVSTCAEYIGSHWKGRDGELNCGYEGAYSENPCPRPTLGGCQINAGTEFEMITWHYAEGGGGFTAEVIPYSAAACNATGSTWVNSN